MTEYYFSVIVKVSEMTHEEILDVADRFGNAGCTDASIRGHRDGVELLFSRRSDSLQSAIISAITDIERVGYRVSHIEMAREAVCA